MPAPGFRGRLGSSTGEADLRAAIDHDNAEPALVQIGVTAPTQQAQIVQIGAAPMTPMHHMMGLGVAHLPPTAHTPLIPHGQATHCAAEARRAAPANCNGMNRVPRVTPSNTFTTAVHVTRSNRWFPIGVA